jgi:hypothetical protein
MVNRYYSSTAVTTALANGITASQTSMVVGTTSGFPTSFPFTLAIGFDTATEELVNVTGVSGTTLTIVRGQDGTTAQDHDAGSVIKHVISARDLREPQEHIAATSDIHGVTGSLADAIAAAAASGSGGGDNNFSLMLMGG